jgi:hypothetical protein
VMRKGFARVMNGEEISAALNGWPQPTPPVPGGA